MPVDTTKSVPAVQQFGLEPGARTPAESAQMKTVNAANEQNANNQQAGSKKRRRKYKGGRGDQPGPNEIVVPQPTALAEPAGPVDANANTAKGTETLTNSAAQSEFDNQVGKGGGKRYRKTKQKKYQIGCSSKRRGGNKRVTKRRKGTKRKHYSTKRRGGVASRTRRRKRRYTKKRR
jgi:hypothetical protein